MRALIMCCAAALSIAAVAIDCDGPAAAPGPPTGPPAATGAPTAAPAPGPPLGAPAGGLLGPAATVAAVLAGDALRLEDGTVLRLRGVDAPGPEAKAFTAALLARHGPEVRLTSHGPDGNGGTLAKVALSDGTDLGAALLADGHAGVR